MIAFVKRTFLVVNPLNPIFIVNPPSQFAVIDLYQYFNSASTAFLSKKFMADIVFIDYIFNRRVKK